MDFTGAEIPAWGMFALAVIWMAFQFVMKWQQTQNEKRLGKPQEPAAAIAMHDQALRDIVGTLASITAALGTVSTVLAGLSVQVDTIAGQTDELHNIHLGPKALDDDNRPKWWADRQSMRRMTESIDQMSNRMSTVERSLSRSSRSGRTSDSLRDIPAVKKVQ